MRTADPDAVAYMPGCQKVWKRGIFKNREKLFKILLIANFCYWDQKLRSWLNDLNAQLSSPKCDISDFLLNMASRWTYINICRWATVPFITFSSFSRITCLQWRVGKKVNRHAIDCHTVAVQSTFFFLYLIIHVTLCVCRRQIRGPLQETDPDPCYGKLFFSIKKGEQISWNTFCFWKSFTWPDSAN